MHTGIGDQVIAYGCEIHTGVFWVCGAPRGLFSGPTGAPAVYIGYEHSWVAAHPTVMSWYVAVNTLFTLPNPQPGALGRQFSEFPAASRSADRVYGIGPIGPYHLAIGKPLF